jgi:hypothetical protein
MAVRGHVRPSMALCPADEREYEPISAVMVASALISSPFRGFFSYGCLCPGLCWRPAELRLRPNTR